MRHSPKDISQARDKDFLGSLSYLGNQGPQCGRGEWREIFKLWDKDKVT